MNEQKDRPEEKGLKVLVDGEWHEASDEFKETVRSIDEGLKRLDRPDREKEISDMLVGWKDAICRMVESNCETVAKSPIQITKKILALFPEKDTRIAEMVSPNEAREAIEEAKRPLLECIKELEDQNETVSDSKI